MFESPLSSPPVAAGPDGTGLINADPWLKPYADVLRRRYAHYQRLRQRLDESGGLLGPISQGHHYLGLNRGENAGQPGVWYREWAPGAEALYLIGDFNGWDRRANPLRKDAYGIWSVFLPDQIYAARLIHGSQVKVHVVSAAGAMDRIPAYIHRAVQHPDTLDFTGVYWHPPEPFRFQHSAASPLTRRRGGLRIYEAHVGMAQEQPRVGTFREFTANILPRIAKLHYNAVQLMAIMEHPYYSSFGYHVSNFYAVSSRFGTPEDLKQLIDTAHGLGLAVLLDVIHSHAVKNRNEGLALFDGTEFQYFHAGPRGHHVAWDSLCFDYRRFEVQRFLLSNLRYWLEEFQFDGFRFDGVTSMLYLDHGLGAEFKSYDDYFGGNVDPDALAYLQLANQLVHTLRPAVITLAEDVSGMPGMARPVPEGGLGFDYRLAMGVPDYWIKLLKEQRDEDWSLGGLYHTLLNRRRDEKHVGYVESHDQALVGDKTLAFRLMDQEMYTHMSKFTPSPVIDRGLALHKMIRLLTFSLAGEAYLNFMGNEFGHPEWIDFPRPGNNFSYLYARRLWSLAGRTDLHYAALEQFDRAMQCLDETWTLLENPWIEQLLVHEDTRQLAFRRGELVFVFNFHPNESFSALRVPVPQACHYRVVLDTDAPEFDGQGRVQRDQLYPRQDVAMYDRAQSVQIYLPCRSAQILAPVPSAADHSCFVKR
ncbi:MAG: alpha amylase C-terminal domain-containing protein [Planctomycetes bacterium]|nr:alpha amylase C-terminal domain-containing protein [Planctomycetota bacterium]